MKTIFNWLTMPVFRERTAMFLGRRDPEVLDIWIDGYWLACEDAGEYDRLRTPGGVPIHLLRDYSLASSSRNKCAFRIAL